MQDEMQQEAPVTETTAPEIEQAQAEKVEARQDGEQEQQDDAQKSDQPRDEKGRFKGVQQRIDEITRARYEAEREAAYWRQRAEQGQTQAQPNSPQGAPAKPSPDQFSDYSEYVEALADWKAEQKVHQALSARDAQFAQTAEQRAEQARVQAWAERQQAVRETLPDYDEVVGLSEIQIAPHVGQELLDSPHGPQIAYHLARNPDVADRLNRLPPRDVIREIARLEATLPAPKPAAKPVSNAPAPIKPIAGGATGVNAPLDKLSMDQYIERRSREGARWAR